MYQLFLSFFCLATWVILEETTILGSRFMQILKETRNNESILRWYDFFVQLWYELWSGLHVAELDVLISLAIASDYYEGPTCRPIISGLPCPDEVPFLCAKSLGHPVLRSDSMGKNTFVPNDVTIGSSGHANFILLTGPNMGGKSTLLRQVCLATILAQVRFSFMGLV